MNIKREKSNIIKTKEIKSFSIRIPHHLAEQIKNIATQEKRSLNGQIEWILEQYISHKG